MPSSWFQKLVFLILFYHSAIECKSISKRELKRPKTVVGEVYSYIGSEMGKPYTINPAAHRVLLRDLRSIDEIPDLEIDGFTYVTKSPAPGIENFDQFSPEHKAALEADAVRLVKDLTGAETAVASGGAYRDHTSPDIADSVRMIHSDISPEGVSWTKNLAALMLSFPRDQEKFEVASRIREGAQVAIYNVWRPLETVHDNHLGFCKWDPQLKEDALKSFINPQKALDALQPWRYSERQKWFYLSQQEPHEAYIFKQHDDRAADHHGVNVPHASFHLQGERGPQRRKSFEVKIFVTFNPPATKKSPFQVKERIQNLFKLSTDTMKNSGKKKAALTF